MTVSRSTAAGRAYLDLQSQAREQGRPTSELLQIYALEGFLDRLSRTLHVDNLVLKGGVLLAAFDTRRATRDVDLQAAALSNEAGIVQKVMCEIADVTIDDGLVFDTGSASTEIIRDDDEYSGVRVSIPCRLATADVSFHVDVNVGDAIWPTPEIVELPRLLGGTLRVRGYSIEMVLAEKLVTAVQRGTASTRWRDFFDIYSLTKSHPLRETILRGSIQRVAEGRSAVLTPLSVVLVRYEAIAQSKWSAWLRRQGLNSRIPDDFGEVLDWIKRFADPILDSNDQERRWNSTAGAWLPDTESFGQTVPAN